MSPLRYSFGMCVTGRRLVGFALLSKVFIRGVAYCSLGQHIGVGFFKF